MGIDTPDFIKDRVRLQAMRRLGMGGSLSSILGLGGVAQGGNSVVSQRQTQQQPMGNSMTNNFGTLGGAVGNQQPSVTIGNRAGGLSSIILPNRSRATSSRTRASPQPSSLIDQLRRLRLLGI